MARRRMAVQWNCGIAGFLIVFGLAAEAKAQQKREPQPKRPLVYFVAPRRIIDLPTAGTLPRGYFDMELRMFANEGVLTAVNIGLTQHFELGLSYGAEHALGNQGVNWNPRAEFNVKLRPISETMLLPAIAVGFESQGFGGWDAEQGQKRYAVKSRGFYGVVSKSYVFTGFATGFHGGVNYSFENDDGDRSPNLFGAMDMRFSDNVAFLGEYDLALNDNNGDRYGKGRGYLNLGVRWVFSDQLDMEVDLKDLFQNRRGTRSFGREFRLLYIEHF